MGKAKLAGATLGEALHVAARMKIDKLGELYVGSSSWRTTGYQGYISYQGPLSPAAAIVYMEKSCGKTMLEEYKDGRYASLSSDGGESEIGGSEGWEPGGVYAGNIPSGCYTTQETITSCLHQSNGTGSCRTDTSAILDCPTV